MNSELLKGQTMDSISFLKWQINVITSPWGAGEGGEKQGGQPCLRKLQLSFTPVSETDNSCKVCCRDPSGRCVPYTDAEQKNLFLRKGKPCTVGFCDMNVSICIQLFFCNSPMGKFLYCKYSVLQMEEHRTGMLPCPLTHCSFSCKSLVKMCGRNLRGKAMCSQEARARPLQRGRRSPDAGRTLVGLVHSWLVWGSKS